MQEKEEDMCSECGMAVGRGFIGTPVCMRSPKSSYSEGRKKELAEANCFIFRSEDEPE